MGASVEKPAGRGVQLKLNYLAISSINFFSFSKWDMNKLKIKTVKTLQVKTPFYTFLFLKNKNPY